MPSLASMRQIEPGASPSDNLIGPKVERKQPEPPPAPKPTGTPGVFEAPDGKLFTDLPEPKGARLDRDDLSWYDDILKQAFAAKQRPRDPGKSIISYPYGSSANAFITDDLAQHSKPQQPLGEYLACKKATEAASPMFMFGDY